MGNVHTVSNPKIHNTAKLSNLAQILPFNLFASPKNAMSETIEAPGAACLTALPIELLMQIMSLLPRNGNCLAPLCRVCRIFRTVVQPYLYSTITLTMDCDEKIPDSGALSSECGNSNVSQFSRLVDTLSKNPTLRTYPRELRLKSDCKGETLRHLLGLQFRLLEILPSLQDLSLSPSPVFSEFSSMPSLRSLQLEFPLEIMYLHFENYDSWHDTQSAEVRVIKNCLLIPTLRVFKIEGLILSPLLLRSSIAFPNFGHRSSAISDLHLTNCDMTSAVLIGILLSIRELKHFVLEGFNCPSYGSLGKALEPHRGCLEELIIAPTYTSRTQIRPPIVSLVDYVALKRLAVTEYFLDAHNDITMQRAIESLPRQLEVLQLQHQTKDQKEMALHMDMRVLRYRSLAANKATLLPALKCVIWWNQVSFKFDTSATEEVYCSDGMKALLPRFQDVGVDFQWGWSDYFWSTPFGKPSKDGMSNVRRTECPWWS